MEKEAKKIINKYNELIDLVGIADFIFRTEESKSNTRKSYLEKGLEELKKIGYIIDEETIKKSGRLVINELKIQDLDEVKKEMYKKYICDILGHEYIRNSDNSIKYEIEGLIMSTYTDNYYEDERKLISPGCRGTEVATCKYCGEKIRAKETFSLDYLDKINLEILNKPNQKIKTPKK